MIKKIITKVLSWEAKNALAQHKPKIIGVTGSVGKSSTKEAVATVLESKYKIRKSIKSYNSELGLALAILGLKTAWQSPSGWLKNIWLGFKEIRNKEFPEFLVLEMGVDRPKDFDRLLKIAKPSVGIVTAIGQIPVHVEFFSGPEEIAKEKSKLIKCLPTEGHAILNFDDETVLEMKEKTKAHVVTYGFGKGADLSASNYKISNEGITFKMDYNGTTLPIKLNKVFGKHHIYPALAAIAVGNIFDINLIESATALSKYVPPPGRLQLIDGVKNSLILDDSYNASPLATHAALDTLAELEAIRKIVAFGDMLELGKFTIPAHQAVGAKIAKVADYFIAIGPRAKFAADEAIASGMDKEKIKTFSISKEAVTFIKDLIKEGDIILIKGSQSMRMELISEELMAHPEDAEKLLPRQDEYWKNKA